MGRKIPGKKHRGVKDPEKQRRTRFQHVAGKINAPPTDPDDQIVSSSLKRIIELKEKTKSKEPRKQSQPPPQFVQGPNESDKNYLHRVHRATQDVLREAKFEKKFNVNIKRDPQTGDVKVVKAEKDELLEYLKQVRKEQKNKSKKKKKTKVAENTPRLTKSQKRTLKLKERKAKKNEGKYQKNEVDTDVVKFGEVAHAPPALIVPRRAKDVEVNHRKPAQKELLMKSMLNTSGSNISSTEKSVKVRPNIPKKSDGSINKKSKRKLLPVALRRQLEKDQQEVIQKYRQMKAEKLKAAR